MIAVVVVVVVVVIVGMIPVEFVRPMRYSIHSGQPAWHCHVRKRVYAPGPHHRETQMKGLQQETTAGELPDLRSFI